MSELGPNSFTAQPDTTKLPLEHQRGAGRDATTAVASEPLGMCALCHFAFPAQPRFLEDICDGADPRTEDTPNQTNSQSSVSRF